MTEALTLNPGNGGAQVAIDELETLNGAPAPTGLLVQRMKVGFGSDGDLRDVDSANPLPVSGPLTDAQLRATPLAVSVAEIEIKNDSGNPLPVSGPLTDAQLRATAVPVSLSAEVEVKNDAGNPLAVSAASLPLPPNAATAANQAATNTSLASIDTDVGAIDAAPAAADGTGNYSIIAGIKRALLNWANLLARIPAALGQTTMAGSWPVALASDHSALAVATADVTAAGTITTQNVVPAGVATPNSAVAITPAGRGGLVVQVTGTYTGALSLQGTVDGSVWVTIGGTPLKNINTGALSATIASATQSIFQAEVTGFAQVRLTALAAVTGTANVTMRATDSPPLVGIDAPLPTGSNVIGGVTISGNPVLAASSATIGNLTRQSGFNDSTTVLAAAATFTGTGRATTGANYSRFVGAAFADQAGTLFVERSTDTGTTWRLAAPGQAVAAGECRELSVTVTGAAGAATPYRVRYVNGATLQGAFQLTSAFVA